jgi:hypothetical protein
MITHEARIISGLDQIEEQFPIAPALPFDDSLYAYDLGKARDSNRLPARVLNDAFNAELVGDQRTAEDYGLPMQKTAVVEEDEDEPIALSPELMAKIQEISGYIASASWRSFSRSLTKAVAQPLAQRSKAFCGDPSLADSDPRFDFDKGRKVLSVERDGKLKITKFEGGELIEIVED